MKAFADESLAIGWRIVKKDPPQTAATVIAKAVLKLSPGVCEVLPIEDITLTGDAPFDDDPAKGNRYESDFAPFKPRADVLLVGAVHAPVKKPVPRLQARLRVGNLAKTIDVVGRREWKTRLLGTHTDPEPFATMPLRYEFAAGGPKNKFNPIGAAGDALPNFELPPQKSGEAAPRDASAPAGFGPVSAAWLPRAGLVGTYDSSYAKTRWPWFPVDFDWAYFNAAPRDQQVEGYLRGDELLEFENLHPEMPVYASRLPSVRARWFINERHNGELRFREAPLVLDTLWIDMDNARVVLVWRGLTNVQTMRLKEIEQILVVLEPMGAVKTVDHYRDDLTKRLNDEAVDLDDELDNDPQMAKAEADINRLKAEGEADRAAAGPLIPPSPREADAGLAERIAGLEADVAGLAPSDPARPKVQTQLDNLIALRDLENAADPVTRSIALERAARKESFAGLNLSDLDLSNLDLSGIDFTEADLSKANLANAKLTNAVLTGAMLFGANLNGANLSGANLDDALLDEAILTKVTIARVSLVDASLSKLNLAGIDLSGCQAKGADFTGSNLAGARFVAANLQQANLSECNLEGADLSKASLQASVFDAVKARGIKMTEANITGLQAGDGADFSEGHFQRVKGAGAVFEECVLDRADFSGSVLTRSQFSMASMREVKCDRVDFTKTDFSDAILHRAILTNCNLLRASFDRADLTKVDARDSNLYEAGFWESITKDANWRGANLSNTLLG